MVSYVAAEQGEWGRGGMAGSMGTYGFEVK
jgi:hypothetical protein